MWGQNNFSSVQNVTRLIWSWFNTFFSSNWMGLWVFTSALAVMSSQIFFPFIRLIFFHSRMETQHWCGRVSRAMRKWWESSSRKGLLLTCRIRYYSTGHFISCFLLESGAILWNESSACRIHNVLVVMDVWQWAKMPLLLSCWTNSAYIYSCSNEWRIAGAPTQMYSKPCCTEHT